jgi:hypothetical protein
MVYVMVKKIKVAPIRDVSSLVRYYQEFHYYHLYSLVTRIAAGVGALDEGDVNYIEIPCIITNEHYLIQGHNLKTNAAGELLYTFSSCTNLIWLPNPDLRLYKCQKLTFDLETTEETHRKSVSGRVTRSRTRKEAASSS